VIFSCLLAREHDFQVNIQFADIADPVARVWAIHLLGISVRFSPDYEVSLRTLAEMECRDYQEQLALISALLQFAVEKDNLLEAAEIALEVALRYAENDDPNIQMQILHLLAECLKVATSPLEQMPRIVAFFEKCQHSEQPEIAEIASKCRAGDYSGEFKHSLLDLHVAALLERQLPLVRGTRMLHL
jgi:hypothetical protein